MLDLDGTIADTIGSIRDAVNLALKKNGYADRSYDQVRMAIGSGARMLIDRSIRIEDSAVDTETVTRVYADYESFYDVTYDHIDGCYEGMREALHTLHEMGYTLAVLSNKQDFYVKKIVQLLFADGIVAYAQGQTELPVKPDPTAPLMIAEKLILSHEPVDVPWAYNIHGHDHKGHNRKNHTNVCVDVTGYQPINMNQWMKSGAMAHVETIHRNTIDKATVRKKKRGCSIAEIDAMKGRTHKIPKATRREKCESHV